MLPAVFLAPIPQTSWTEFQWLILATPTFTSDSEGHMIGKAWGTVKSEIPPAPPPKHSVE
jgi:hypothetical protein